MGEMIKRGEKRPRNEVSLILGTKQRLGPRPARQGLPCPGCTRLGQKTSEKGHSPLETVAMTCDRQPQA